MAIYLVRHADAGSRGGWSGDDHERPLSKRGRGQAAHLGGMLAEEPIGRIYSSPARRCIETGEPLAAALDLPVRVAMELAEGSDPDAAIAFLLRHADKNPVAVSHGDVIPGIIRRLNAGGMRSNGGSSSQKGSAWKLDVDGGRVVRGTYHPPG